MEAWSSTASGKKVLNKGRNTDLSPIEDAVGGRKAMVMGVTGN